ncbi:MAG: hypothetical protein GWO24_16415 [Akkermansiaceae bacterium]|nr:hypothetical protein [Akkermansiaceae bacterium]
MSRLRNKLVEVTGDSLSGQLAPRVSRAFLRPFLGAGQSLAAVFAALRFVVVAAGAVGRVMAEDLARLAPAELLIVDPKSYHPDSIVTQPIRPSEIGGAKAELTARACKEISPATRVSYFTGLIQELSLPTLARFDRVVLSSDNLLAELETGQICTRLGLPLDHASVHPETMVVHVRSFSNENGDSPCPACQFSAQERELLNREVEFPCDGMPGGTVRPEVTSAPTASNPSLCGLAAKLAMTGLLRDTMGLGATPTRDCMLEYCGFTQHSVVNDLRRNPDCPCEHLRYTVMPASRPLERCSLGELAGLGGLADPLDFTVGDWCWAERGLCTRGHDQVVGRFVRAEQELVGACSRCGEPLGRQRFFLHQRLSIPCFETMGHRPLHELGAKEVEWVLARGEEAGLLFHNPVREHEQS